MYQYPQLYKPLFLDVPPSFAYPNGPSALSGYAGEGAFAAAHRGAKRGIKIGASCPTGQVVGAFPAFSADSTAATTSPCSAGSFHFFNNSPAPQNPSDYANALSHPAPHLFFSLLREQRGRMEVNREDLAAQEEAARDYQPLMKGPLVGDKIPSLAITEEYARADPVYVQKTLALPETYSYYRPIQGDGNCGWRAIAFGYFETLIRTGNPVQIHSEMARIRELDEYLVTAGRFSSFLFESMVDETIGLLERLAVSLEKPDLAMIELETSFNNQDIDNAIVYHMRLLASAYLRGHAELFANFITLDGGVEEYCTSMLERPSTEIEHLGITLLVNVLLKPVNFVLEVAYLDRSQGSEVNTYCFPDEANVQDPGTLGPFIYLLFRPNHYDILYRKQSEVRVHFVGSLSNQFDVDPFFPSFSSYDCADMSSLAMHLPGFGGPTVTFDAPPAHQGPWLPLTYDAPAPAPAPSIAPPSEYSRPRYPPSLVPAPSPPQESPSPTSDTAIGPNHMLRFTKFMLAPEYAENKTWRDASKALGQQQQSAPRGSRNGHANAHHFMNESFTPDQWTPDGARARRGAH